MLKEVPDLNAAIMMPVGGRNPAENARIKRLAGVFSELAQRMENTLRAQNKRKVDDDSSPFSSPNKPLSVSDQFATKSDIARLEAKVDNLAEIVTVGAEQGALAAR